MLVNVDDKCKRKFHAFFGLLVFTTIVFTIFNCGMYADGSYAFSEVLNTDSLWLWHPGRRTPMAFTRIFTILLMRLGVVDFKVLAYSYSFGCTFWVTLFIGLSGWIAYKFNSKVFLNYTICLWGLLLTYTGLYSMHESLFTAASIWYFFAFFYHYDSIKKNIILKIFTIILLALNIAGTHEAYALLGVALLVFMIVNQWKNIKKFDVFYIFSMLLLLVGCGYEWHYSLTSDETSRNSFFSNLSYVDQWLIGLLAIVMIYVCIFGLVYPNEKTENIRKKIEIVLGILIFAFMVKDIEQIVHDSRYIRSVFHVIFPIGLILLMTINIFQEKNKVANITAIMSSLILIGSFISIYFTGYGYSNYLKNINSITTVNEGFVVWPINGEKQVYTTDWPIPFESIIAHEMYGTSEQISSIVVQAQDRIYFQPFNMWDINAYYDMSRYGIVYNKDAFLN